MRPRFLDIDSSSDVRQDHEICNDGSELSNLAKEVLMTVFQSWGWTIQQKVEVLNKVISYVGIKATFFQEDGKSGWKYEDGQEAEAQKAKEFKVELSACFPLGHFESEVAVIREVIEKWKGKK